MPKVFSPLGLSLNLALVLSFASALPSFATAPPVVSPSTGVYSTVQSTVTISGDPGATFYFTTDGTPATTSSTVYSAPFSISNTATIRSVAQLSGMTSSETTSNIQSDENTLGVPRTDLKLWVRGDFSPILSLTLPHRFTGQVEP